MDDGMLQAQLLHSMGFGRYSGIDSHTSDAGTLLHTSALNTSLVVVKPVPAAVTAAALSAASCRTLITTVAGLVVDRPTER